MADVARLRIAVDSDGVRVSRSELDKLGRTGRNTERQVKTATGGMRDDFNRLHGAVTGVAAAFAALGGAMVARELIRTVNLYQRLEGQLKLVTDGTQNLADTQDELFRVSQQTYSSYEGTVQLYARLARNADQLGASQQDLYRFTTATNQAIQISGASAQESASGILQLSQALASGELRGEELRSVMENTPRLARAIATGLAEMDSSFDGTIGGLRDLAEQGELTSERVLAALLNQSDEIESEFQDMGRRVDQAMIQLQNDVQRVFEDTDTQPLIDAIDDLRDAVNDEQFKQGLQFIAKSFVNATAEVTKLIGKVNEFKTALSEPFDLSESLQFLFDRTGVGFAYNNFIKDTEGAGASGSWGPNGQSGEWNGPRVTEPVTVDAYPDGHPLSMNQLSGLNLPEMPDSSGGGSDPDPAGSPEPGRDMEQLRWEEQQRVYDAMQAEAERLERAEQDRKSAVASVTQELMTQDERARAAHERRLQMIDENVRNEEKAADLRSRSLERYVEDLDRGTNEMSEFARRAAENIQDTLGDTLAQTLRGDFDGILDSWANMLIDMAAQAQAAQLNKALFGGEFEKTGELGGILGTIGSSIGGMFGGGPSVTDTSIGSVSTSMADAGIGGIGTGVQSQFGGMFADGGTLGAGKWGIAGEAGPEIVHGPANITPMKEGGDTHVNVDVQIVNEGNGQIQETRRSQSRGPNGRDQIKIYVKGAMNEMVSSGEMDDVMERYAPRRGKI